MARVIRPFPNFDFWFVKSLRQKAVASLELKPGNRVLDAGCGPGGSFPYLAEAVGTSGEVTGIEISPEVAVNARNRVAARGWKNVDIVVGNCESVLLSGQYDGMLFFGAPDCFASPKALDNLLPHLNENCRIAIFSAKLTRQRPMAWSNQLFRKSFARATFDTTPQLDYEPWKLMEQRIGTLEVHEYFGGIFFLASGPIRPSARS
jgi:demethylmenaquinone methyltransferase/2-methoxy-6-polyprenyl-1,4-benzoquinol methylase